MSEHPSVGTHNTHDGVAPATPFAKILIFTEAIAGKVKNQIGDTHHVYPCRWQKDLVIALHKSLKTDKPKPHYRLVHVGIRKVTPHRGSFWLTFDLDGEPYAVLAEHRINAAFPPFKRGEKFLRPRWWKKHTRISLRIIGRLIKRGRTVVAAGDLNTPYHVSGYEGVLHEVRREGEALSRLGATYRWTDADVLSSLESDHNRLWAR